ncbi:MAG: hypothetical protein M1823_001710 [Watsoniomyces obsoletus]|nr:MAG: hypothetical protein M1823_001710 [Watsoniomyces obsoletus]
MATMRWIVMLQVFFIGMVLGFPKDPSPRAPAEQRRKLRDWRDVDPYSATIGAVGGLVTGALAYRIVGGPSRFGTANHKKELHKILTDHRPAWLRGRRLTQLETEVSRMKGFCENVKWIEHLQSLGMPQPRITLDTYFPLVRNAMAGLPRVQEVMEQDCFEWAYANVVSGGYQGVGQEENSETPVGQSNEDPNQFRLDPEEIAQKGVQRLREGMSGMRATWPAAAAGIKIPPLKPLSVPI